MSTIIEARHLKKYFPTPHGMLHAVDDVSFTLEQGKTLGVVGESGCGKSTLGRTLIHLLESTDGEIFFDGRDITRLSRKERREFCNEAQIIFQDPFSSLDPRKTVRQIIAEPLVIQHKLNKKETAAKVDELMELAGIAERFADAYPHELDGGRRQRIGIARALALEPRFIVCDEPVSALDVSIQAQIINLLLDLQEKLGLSYIFITHDLSVVEYIADEVAVMYLGQIVEKAPTEELFAETLHPYTKVLFSAIPEPVVNREKKRIIAKGELTSPINPAPGCRFAARCSYATEACHQPQTLEEIKPGHFISCCRVREINGISNENEERNVEQ